MQKLSFAAVFCSCICTGLGVQPLRQAYDLDLQNSELQQLGQPHQIPVAPVLQLLGDGDLEDEDLDVGSQLLEAGQVAGSGVSEVSAPDPSASPDAPSTPRHPLWVFDAAYLQTGQAYVCSVVLLLSGILCAAGGIGGGGIYVTVLMVAGGLSVRDAVPLSKSIVFFGSLSSLFLNLKKKTTSCGNRSESVIDYNICRVVVPSALIGTYLGVLLNSMLPSLAILLALIGILVSMSWTVTRTALAQYKAEERLSLTEILGDDAENNPAVDLNEPELPRSGFEELKATGSEKGEQVRYHLRNQLARTDIALSLSMLLLIIAGSVFRHHAAACLAARTEQDHADTCQHPTVSFLGKGVLETWMDAPSKAAFINVFCFAGPLIFCCAVLTYSTVTLVTQANWGLGTACHFSLMAIATGCLAGLVGIGGGLVFSPFFLLMGIEPSVAVATSSTCVIFTSSSTTFQFLLTDRIIISLTLIYGLVNLCASYLGTKLVHQLQDKFSKRRSYISAIVAAGVLVSTVLAFTKLLSEMTPSTDGSSAVGAH